MHTTVQARLVGQRLQTQEELGSMQAQGKTLPAHILLGALTSLKAHAIHQRLSPPSSLSSPSLMPPACRTMHLPFKKNPFCFLTRALAHSVLWVSFPGFPSEEDPAESPGFTVVTVCQQLLHLQENPPF